MMSTKLLSCESKKPIEYRVKHCQYAIPGGALLMSRRWFLYIFNPAELTCKPENKTSQ